MTITDRLRAFGAYTFATLFCASLLILLMFAVAEGLEGLRDLGPGCTSGRTATGDCIPTGPDSGHPGR